jgi:hypothetical protein
MKRACSLFAIAMVSGACMTSPSLRDFQPALRPNGIEGSLVMDRWGTHDVELLALTDTAYVVMKWNRVAVAPYRQVRNASFRQFGIAAEEYAPPVGQRREDLRLLSRFPAGISPAVLAALLADTGQTAPDHLGETRP